jgi:hypothetical protein
MNMLMQELTRARRPAAVLAAVEKFAALVAEAPPMDIMILRLGWSFSSCWMAAKLPYSGPV